MAPRDIDQGIFSPLKKKSKKKKGKAKKEKKKEKSVKIGALFTVSA